MVMDASGKKFLAPLLLQAAFQKAGVHRGKGFSLACLQSAG
jgi:hypothetical protein